MIRRWTTKLRGRAERILRPGGRAVVLLYHRIGDDLDSYGLCVTPRHFEEHLEVIREVARPARLADVAAGVRGGTIPDRAVCVSFDDGYVDNVRVAKPLLERHDVPGTVFVTTGRVGREREFWWDELERVFLEPERLPDRLELNVAGRPPHVWHLGADSVRERGDPRWERPWHLLEDLPPTARHAVFTDAHALVKPLPETERTRVMDALRTWAGMSGVSVRASRRAMEPGEVVELANGGLVEVGAHTVSHPSLPAQPAQVKRDEVARSKSTLEEWLGARIDGFAYPYGDYDDESVAAAANAGFAYACSCIYRAARRDDDPYVLPRVEVRDVDGDTLADALRWHLR